MFNSLRKSIANIINPVDKVAAAAAERHASYQDAINDKAAKQLADKQRYLSAKMNHTTPQPRISGNLSADTIDRMESRIGKDAVVQLAAWTQLSQAFTAYNRKMESKRPNPKIDAAFFASCNAFHAWNARLSSSATGIDVEETVARLTIPRAARSNPETDAILARIKGRSIEELSIEREIKAELASRQAEANASGFIAQLEGFAYGDESTPELKASMVLAKAEDTLVWLAGWSTPDVAELLILEADIQMLRKAANHAGTDDAGEFPEGVLATDTLCRMNQR